MNAVYTIREFRAKSKEVLDKCVHETVHIRRGEQLFELKLCTQNGNGVHQLSDKNDVIQVLREKTTCILNKDSAATKTLPIAPRPELTEPQYDRRKDGEISYARVYD